MVVDGKTLTLTGLFSSNGTEMAQVTVNGTMYQVKPGDTFAQYSLTSIADPCADFTSQNTPFRLCLSTSTGS